MLPTQSTCFGTRRHTHSVAAAALPPAPAAAPPSPMGCVSQRRVPRHRARARRLRRRPPCRPVPPLPTRPGPATQPPTAPARRGRGRWRPLRGAGHPVRRGTARTPRAATRAAGPRGSCGVVVSFSNPRLCSLGCSSFYRCHLVLINAACLFSEMCPVVFAVPTPLPMPPVSIADFPTSLLLE